MPHSQTGNLRMLMDKTDGMGKQTGSASREMRILETKRRNVREKNYSKNGEYFVWAH
jgi:hypothetical protein